MCLATKEKVLGVPLICFYHIFTWICAGLIAFDPNGDRLVTETCRQAVQEMRVMFNPARELEKNTNNFAIFVENLCN